MKTKRFEAFSNEFQLLADVSPMLVSVTKNPDDETDEQFITTHDRFVALDDNTKDKLAAPETATKIQNIGKIYNLDLIQIGDISRAIRSFYFSELKLEDMPAVLAKEIPIDLAKAQEISRMVIQKIINDTSVEQSSQAKLVQMTVADALKVYPEVGEQLITSEKIVLKNFPDPVRPCLKNWLADFTFTLGRDKHTAMDRGIYLFQSANGKRLNSQDRNKLAYVLKAFDENLPVSINKDVKQIIFQATTETSENSNPNVKAQIMPNQIRSSNFQNSQNADTLHRAVRFAS
ncbi:MAG: hypothetical protein V1855_04100, partial [bacterium]